MPWTPVPVPDAPVVSVVRHETAVQRMQHGAGSLPASQQATTLDEMVVKSEFTSYDPAIRVFTFTKGVAATYGVTTVLADRLEVHMAEGEEWAKATGNVTVIDPDADM